MKAANEMFTKPAPAVKPGDLAVVVGAGVSGVAAAKLLHKLGARVRLLDRSLDRIPADFAEWAESAGVEIVCGEHSPSQFRDAKLVVPSPGVAAAVISKFLPDDNPPEIMAETELAWRQLSGEPVLGVTGTSGKTTTTSLCAAMLKEQGLTVFTGGNIGTPLSEYILSGEKADVVVLELSSFQLQTCSTLHPRVGILLNISENHLDFHKDMDEYISAKMRLFANQTETDLAVLQDGMDELAGKYGIKARKIHYTESDRFPDMQLMGPHNRCNAEAAWLACREFGVTEEAAARACRVPALGASAGKSRRDQRGAVRQRFQVYDRGSLAGGAVVIRSACGAARRGQVQGWGSAGPVPASEGTCPVRRSVRGKP